ncbi:MAG: redoxin family protein [Pyrinomonadaceae bacterium]
MKVLISIAIIFLCCSFPTLAIDGNLTVGSKFPFERLGVERKNASSTIVVFIPSLSYDTSYASMLTQSFYYYFDQKLAFEGQNLQPKTSVIIVVNDRLDAARSTQNILGEMSVVYDEKAELFSRLSIRPPANKDADSLLFLLDAGNVIRHIDRTYRAQGEHLKPLENKIKELNGLETKPVRKLEARPKLRIGDRAPDFLVDRKTRVSDLRGKVILISFYPAAFSGTFPRPFALKGDIELSFDSASLMACTFQITSLDEKKGRRSDIRRILVSSSTPSLLERWKAVMKTENIEYANDPNYSISQSYFSYNPKGYNNRVSVIVDQEGKIAFIDDDFELHDEAVLNAKLDELAMRSK